MSRIGVDVKFEDGASLLGADPLETLSVAYDLGFEGILLRTVDEAFPTLDAGAIREFAAEAMAWGMFVHLGLGKVNPYMTAELPRVRDLGQGSYLAGMERMIALCGDYGWTEAWTAAGAYKHDLPSPFCFDRFRTDVEWLDQLSAIAGFLLKLAPILREHGVRLNLETHEEITTFEILRLIQELGDDVVGVCLDPANVMVRGEPVEDAVRRAAPYVRLTHLRDAVLVPTEGGLSRFLMPIGEGVIDWDGLLNSILGPHPGLDLIIEGIGGSRAEMELRPDDERWRAAHPDMTDDDGERLKRLASGFAALEASGRAPSVDILRASPPPQTDYRDFLTRSLTALRASLERRTASPTR